jgi:AcrR family transcriptional regulator
MISPTQLLTVGHGKVGAILRRANAGLSMRVLARRAGVSQATPYNLFGTKRAILRAVVHDVETFGSQVAAQRSADPLERIFDVMEAMAGLYAADPGFYRILWQYLFDPVGSPEVRGDFEFSRRAFFRYLVGVASDRGLLNPQLNRELVAMQLEQALFGTASAWLFDYLRPEHLQPMLGLATGMILAGAAADGARDRVMTRSLAYQRALTELGLPEPGDAGSAGGVIEREGRRSRRRRGPDA